MKILVTGGAGFIGSHVVDIYIGAGHEVLVLDNLSSGIKANINPQAKFVELDLNDSQLKSTIENFKPEVINHHAAQINVRVSVDDPKLDASINILGSLNLLESLKSLPSVKKVIFASTGGAIYGDTDTIPTPEDFPAWPVSPYGIAKLTVEHYLYFYHHTHHLNYLALRYGNVYGPRQNPHGEAGVVAIFYNSAKAGQELIINGDGQQARDFVYVADVAHANLLALDSPQVGSLNIGTAVMTNVNALTDKLVATLPTTPQVVHAPAKAGEQQTSCLDYSKAQKLLGWQPQVSLEEGLQRTAEFFMS